MIRRVREFAGADKIVLAGSGCESTEQTRRMTSAMADAGADAAVVITPSYYFKGKTPSSLANILEAHFLDVADASPIPTLLYNVPANAALELSAESVSRLSRHPNIVGTKESGGDVVKIARIVHEADKEFQVLAGSAGFLAPALLVGAVGGICALANALPNEVVALQRLFQASEMEKTSELQRRLVLPNHLVTKAFGVPGLKKAMEWFGYYGGPCRKPLLPLSSEEEVILKQAFEQFL